MAKKPKKLYAIIREEKRSCLRQVARSSGHNNRTRPCKNADPNGPPPTLLHGDWGLAAAIKAIIPKPKDRRKNAVIAVETVLTTSPEWFAQATAKDRREWIDANLAWLHERHGANLVQVVLHEDEKTPHLHAYWVPMKDGALNYYALQGQRADQKKLQDSYAEAMQRFGLARGEPKSQRRHEHHSKVVDQLATCQAAIKKAAKLLIELVGLIDNAEASDLLAEAGRTLVEAAEGHKAREVAATQPAASKRAPAVEHRPAWNPPQTRIQPGSMRP